MNIPTTSAVTVHLPEQLRPLVAEACRERQTTGSALARAALIAYAARRGVTLPERLRAQPRRADVAGLHRRNVYLALDWVPLLAPMVTRTLSWLCVEALAEMFGVEPGVPWGGRREAQRTARPRKATRVPVARRASHAALAAFLARRDAETQPGKAG